MNPESTEGTLLIVDDDPGGREALEGLLLNQGHRLEFAASGQEALHMIQQQLPDLVLLDVMMPRMDGFEVCRRLRADAVTAEMPIVFVTALDDRETRLEGISAGADDFISKPFDRVELRLRVKTIMRIGRYRRLLTERARFSSVVEQAADGYLTLKDDGRISYANSAARRFLDLGDYLGREALGDFFGAARRQYRIEPDRAWTDHELRVPGTHCLVRPETSTAGAFWLAVTLLDPPGSSSGERLLRLHDITDEIGLQQDRHSFHRMISHKLRTPLNGIVSILELLKSELEGGEQAELFALAVESADRLCRGVEDILSFADLSRQRLQEASFPLAQLSELVERLRAEMEIKVLERKIYPALLGEKIPFSVAQFETVCREIFENARKFHPKKNPTIFFTAEYGAARHLLLTILDDGVHLSPDQLSQVWVPYYQAEKHATGEVAGMGLGLSVVKSNLASKGGGIRLKNNADGPGIEVTIDAPLVEH
jgi:two-component system cell cycle response regulator